MDYQSLMKIASAKQESKDKIKINRYSSELPPPKKENKDVARSDVIKKLIQEKENEKHRKENAKKEEEKKKKEREENKKTQFRIPKKKAPEINTDELMTSLFGDAEDGTSVPSGDPSSRLSPVASDETKKTESEQSSDNKNISSASSKKEKSSHHDSSKSSSSLSAEKKSHGSSSSHSKSSSSKSSSSHSKSSSSHSKSSSSHSKSSSSNPSKSSSSHSKSSSSNPSKSSSSNSKSSSSNSSKSSSSHSKSSSSHSKSSSSHSKSSSSREKTKSSSSSGDQSNSSLLSSSSSKHDRSSSSSSHNNSKSSLSSSSSTPTPLKLASEQPVVLSKHHLKPITERQASDTKLTEKEKILAKLRAIKERTLAAINKEQEGKGRRSKGEKSHQRNSRKETKEDDRIKSKEIIKDIYSSDDEAENSNMPSVIDIMLSEHQTKLEKDKITRMAKQAWERATKGDDDESTRKNKEKKVRKKMSYSKLKASKNSSNNRDNHKRKEHRLSPDSSGKARVKNNEEQRKKPKIVRHAGQGAPPPMDFKAILAMAEQKVREPSKPISLTSIPKKKKKEEEARPMTQEEKERQERIKSKDYQHWLKFGGKIPNGGKEYSSSEDDVEDTRKKEKQAVIPERHRKENGHTVVHDKKSIPSSVSNSLSNGRVIPKHGGKNSSSVDKSREISVNENVLVCGPAEDEESDDGPSRQAENPFDRIYKTVHKKRPVQAAPGMKRKHVELDSEAEEESDLEGFIDDGMDGEEDYSKHISKIFGYNKHKYVDEDDNLSDMEANFDTVMKEEKRSAKMGLMEDLEDMRQEEEELKRKALLKKKMRK